MTTGIVPTLGSVHLTACFLLLFFSVGPAIPADLTGRVVGIADGDTLTVLDGQISSTRFASPALTGLKSANPTVKGRARIWLHLHSKDRP